VRHQEGREYGYGVLLPVPGTILLLKSKGANYPNYFEGWLLRVFGCPLNIAVDFNGMGPAAEGTTCG